MVTQSPRRAAILIAVVFIIASIALSLFVWSSLGGGLPLSPKGYRFHATFENASQLQSNAAVRIAGVDVGRVIRVDPVGLRTDATIELQPQFAPIPVDTRAILRQKTLLGETFVVLTTGSRDAERISEGGRLDDANVESTQPLDRVLGMLDPETRDRVQSLFTDGAATFRGRGDDVNQALGELGPLADDFDVILEILDRQRASVGGLVRDAGTVLRTLGDHQSALAEIVSAGSEVMAATASRDRSLNETVRALAPLVETMRGTSDAVTRTATITGPVLRELRPAAPDLAPALSSLRRLTPQVEAVLGELDATLPVAKAALPATAHLVRGLGPFVEVVYPATREITPIIDLVAKYRRELSATLANVSAASNASSPGTNGGNAHYIRTLVPINEESIVGYSERLPSNRHAAYLKPGGLARLGDGGLLAADCRNTANPQIVPVIGSVMDCKLSPPWTFNGNTGYYPHVERVPGK